jgi:hypothetical protein
MRKTFGLGLMIMAMLLVNVSLSFAGGIISVTPISHDYGDVELGDSPSQEFTIENSGFQTLTINAITFSGTNSDQFSTDATTPISVPAQQSRKINVTFTPDSVDSKSATLEIANNSFNDTLVEVPLSGTGATIFAPTDLQAIDGMGVGNVGIELTWTDVSQVEEHYKIERKHSSGQFLPIATLDANSTSYIDEYRKEQTTYEYQVYAYNADMESDKAEASATTGDYVDDIKPEITSQVPPDGTIVIIEYEKPYSVEIEFNEWMNMESVLKSTFIRRLGDEAEVINADICLLLTWFGHQGDDPQGKSYAEKYNRYGCSPPYGTVDAGKVDVNFDDALNLEIDMERLDIGEPSTGPIRPAVYTLEILKEAEWYPEDLAENPLDKAHTEYEVTMQASATVTDPDTEIVFGDVDSNLTVSITPADFGIPAGAEVTIRPIYPNETPVHTVSGTLGTFVVEYTESEESQSLLSITPSSTGQITVKYPDDTKLPTHPGEAAIRVYKPDADNNRWAPILGVLPDMDTNTFNVEIETGKPYAIINSVPYGDLNGENGDGLRNAHDVLSIMKHVVTPMQKAIFNNVDPVFAKYASDVSITTPGADPEEPDSDDVLIIMKEIVGLIDEYPVEGITAAPGLITLYPPASGDSVLFLKHSRFGNSGTISVILDGTSEILSAEVGLVYDAQALKFNRILETSNLPNKVIEYNSENSGEIQIALVSVQTLSNEDSILNIQFEMAEGASKFELDSVKLTKVKLNNGLVKARVEPLPQKLALLQNYPNPFNPETWIPYRLNQDSDVAIRIYNINGQLVQTLNIGNQSPGNYITKEKAAYWDGRNITGEKVTSGVYFYQLLSGQNSIVRKMVILK